MIKNFLDADEGDTPIERTASVSQSILDEPPILQQNVEPDLSDPFSLSDIEIERALDTAEAQSTAAGPDSLGAHTPAVLPSTSEYTAPTQEQSARMSGLALTAGIAFASSVAFMLCLGWLMDVMMGTSPWGIVGGIVLGSIIGFVQFFRLNSQILNAQSGSRPRSLMDLGGEEISPVTHDDAPANTDKH